MELWEDMLLELWKDRDYRAMEGLCLWSYVVMVLMVMKLWRWLKCGRFGLKELCKKHMSWSCGRTWLMNLLMDSTYLLSWWSGVFKVTLCTLYKGPFFACITLLATPPWTLPQLLFTPLPRCIHARPLFNTRFATLFVGPRLFLCSNNSFPLPLPRLQNNHFLLFHLFILSFTCVCIFTGCNINLNRLSHVDYINYWGKDYGIIPCLHTHNNFNHF